MPADRRSFVGIRRSGVLLLCGMALGSGATISRARAGGLKESLGRNEVRVYGAPYRIELGTSVTRARLVDRLERLEYSRVHSRPTEIGQYFWGTTSFWIYRRPFRFGGDQVEPALLGLDLNASCGRILGFKDSTESTGFSTSAASLPRVFRLEPEILAESLRPNHAVGIEVSFDNLPEHVWRSVLAAEDARFFEHRGIDARSVARAAIANARHGRVTQGGSTITQQLIKIRDLSPKRTVGRKLSEAARAMVLEAQYSKEEILESYLNSIYFGHYEGVELWGLGTAAQVFFSKPPRELNLEESAVLAAVIQAPNRFNPERHPEALEGRWRWVLSRLRELEWVEPEELNRIASAKLPGLRLQSPEVPPAHHFIDWVGKYLASVRPKKNSVSQGAILETTLDLQLQRDAEAAITSGLDRIRARLSTAQATQLSAALIAVNARSGDVVAYVGGDPRRRIDGFDRVRNAHRQPGSAIKPLVLLEAFESCGRRSPLYPAQRITDRALRRMLPSGPWEPQNADGRFHGTVTLRQAVIASLNTPFVRLADWCGFDATAKRVRRAGLPLPEEAKAVPASFVLGSVEASPLEILTSFTVIGALGYRTEPRPIRRIRLPSGRLVKKVRASQRKVVGRPAAYLIRDMLEDVISEGTARAGKLEGVDLWGKTGTSSQGRDAWMVGGFGDYLAVVWVGLDKGAPVGLSGSRAALPIWRQFIHAAAGQLPADKPARPRGVVERLVHESSGLLARRSGSGIRKELFRRGYLPKQKRFWRRNSPTEVIE
ncbi:MAG: transglycosylase domain-containing protein [Thermoanaerobaculia bacterium]